MLGTIRRRLVVLVLLVALPLVGATLLVVNELAGVQRQSQLEAMMGSTRALATAVDAEVNRHLAAAHALTASRALRADDLATFHTQATEALKFLPKSWLVLIAPDGQQLVNTQQPWGAQLPKLSNQATHRRTVETGSPQVSDIVFGQVAGRAVAGVFVPVIREGAVRYVILIVVSPDGFLDILRGQKFRDGWLAAVIDRSSRFVARNVGHAENLGKPASVTWRTALAEGKSEGFYEGPSVEGTPIVGAYVNSPLSSWSISIAATDEVLTASTRRTLLAVGLISAALIGLSIILALWASRRIAEPLKSLQFAASALMRGEPGHIGRTSLREVDQALDAFDIAAAELREREKRQALMVNELNHRVKNTLSVVQSIATLTVRSAASLKDFGRSFSARLIGISRTHDLLTASHWVGANLRDIIANELAPHDRDDRRRIILRGEPVQLSPRMSTSLGMVVHELATNAAKYGALSVPEGRVEVSWTIAGSCEAPRLQIVWRESGGPAVQTPERDGFGSMLIRANVTGDLGGTVALDFDAVGLVCTIDVPLTPSVEDAASNDNAVSAAAK